MRTALSIIFFCIVNTSPLCACLCSPPSIESSLQNSDLIFSGMAISLSETSEDRTTTCSFSVSSVWKGAVADTIKISTPIDVASCGFKFLPGKEYLVYAKSQGNTYSTNICTRSSLLEKVTTDLFILPEPIYSLGEISENVPTVEAFIREQLWKLENQSTGNHCKNLMDLIEYHQLQVPELTRIAEGNFKTDFKGQELAINILGSFGYYSRPAIPVLMILLCHESLYIRCAASYSLVNIFPEGFQLYPESFFIKDFTSLEECSARIKKLQEIEFGALPPDSLINHGGTTGPLYFIRNRLWE